VPSFGGCRWGGIIKQQITKGRTIRLGFNFGAQHGGKGAGKFGMAAGVTESGSTDNGRALFFRHLERRLSLP
jgi:hypothetical protein